jgi:hypothetical protein
MKVRLSAGGANGRTLLCVELPELYTRFIGVFGHLAPEGIDLFYQMPLGKTSNGRVARHTGNAVQIDCKQKGRVADSSTGQCRLAACMSCADNDNIKFTRKANKNLFPNNPVCVSRETITKIKHN